MSWCTDLGAKTASRITYEAVYSPLTSVFAVTRGEGCNRPPLESQ
jgi:hypothetical protein